MGVSPPTVGDLEEVLAQLDDNFDGIVDKEEFLKLFMHVIGNMFENESDLYQKLEFKRNQK